jgi:hypothetical protein
VLVYNWISVNRIGDEGAKAIAQLLIRNTSLQTLSLYGTLVLVLWPGYDGTRTGNDIGDVGAEAIATALTSNNSLLSLNLESASFVQLPSLTLL